MHQFKTCSIFFLVGVFNANKLLKYISLSFIIGNHLS